MKPLSEKSRQGFTLIELLVTLSIVGVLSTTAIITLNPAELIAQSRDAVRISDLSTINSALGIYNTDVNGGSFGSSTVVYTSLPDTDSTCASYLASLPATSTVTYHCASTSTLRNADGTGWIPVDFTKITFGNPLPSLPVDPINTTAGCGNYYTYTPATNPTSWELTAAMASTKYSAKLGNVHTAGTAQGITPAAVTGRCGAATSTPGGAGGTYSWIPGLSAAPTRPADVTGPNGYGDYNGTSLEIWIMVLDADNVPVAGATIDCSAAGSGNHYYGPFNSPTGSDGVASCNIGTSEVGSKSVTITVTLPGGGTFTVHPTDEATHTTEEYAVFTPSETADNSSVAVVPTSLPADGYSQTVLTLTALDADHNPVPYAATGCNGSYLIDRAYQYVGTTTLPDAPVPEGGPPNGGFYRIGDSRLTGVDGTMQCTMSSDVVRDAWINAGFTSIWPNNPPATTYTPEGTTTIYDIYQGGYVANFTTPNPETPATHTFEVDTSSTPAGNPITATITLKDYLGNGLQGIPIGCTASGSVYDVSEPVQETDVNGLLQCQFWGDAGSATIGANVEPLIFGGRPLDGVTVEFTP